MKVILLIMISFAYLISNKTEEITELEKSVSMFLGLTFLFPFAFNKFLKKTEINSEIKLNISYLNYVAGFLLNFFFLFYDSQNAPSYLASFIFSLISILILSYPFSEIEHNFKNILLGGFLFYLFSFLLNVDLNPYSFNISKLKIDYTVLNFISLKSFLEILLILILPSSKCRETLGNEIFSIFFIFLNLILVLLHLGLGYFF